MKTNNILTLALLAGLSLPAMAQYDIIDSVAYKDQRVDVGASRTFTRENSAAAASVITSKDVNRRGARNIGNNLIGQGNGLVSLQGAGIYNAANPTFYVRGLQSLSGSTPLILVDGIERSIDNVHSQDVESVTVLKDAAATALNLPVRIPRPLLRTPDFSFRPSPVSQHSSRKCAIQSLSAL